MKTAVLVGCGAMSDGWLRALRDTPALAKCIGLVGMVDLDLATATARAAKHNLSVPVGTDLAAMLAQTRPDMVFDLVVPAARDGVVRQALAAGAHVLSEKPMAHSLAGGARPDRTPQRRPTACTPSSRTAAFCPASAASRR